MQAGLRVVASGRGGLQPLLDRHQPEHRRLLRLAGRERTVLDPPEATTIITREVYASEAVPPPEALLEALTEPALALLHSGEAAARLLSLCVERGLDRSRVHLAAISPRVAARAGPGWASIRSAAHPEDSALLALAVQMCQEVGPGQ